MAFVTSLLIWLWFHVICCGSDGVTSVEECFDLPLPVDLKEWRSDNSGDIVVVVWNFDRVCADISQCYRNNSYASLSSVNFISFNQLPPVQIRSDQAIGFRTERGGDQSVQLKYYKVSEEGFERCVALDDEHVKMAGDTLLELVDGTLTMGNNYFIANNFNRTASFWQCSPYGLRVNVTVQGRHCNQESNTTNAAGKMCHGRGRCAVRIYEPSYRCHCCPGFKGEFCEEVDGCYGVQCLQGTCIDGPDDGISPSFTCVCDPGFTGVRCETVSGELCATNDCMNGGVCVTANDTKLGFYCYCGRGLTGKVCETDINECGSNPCMNGQCTDRINGYHCECETDYSGAKCEFYIGPCPVGRCVNEGTCQPIPETNDSSCICPSGYTGSSCEAKIELCHSNLCANAIDCIDYGHSFKCICNPGYSGIQCEINVDECASNPCQNGGTCHDHVAAFSCDCPEGFPQPNCQIPDSEAESKDTKAESLLGLTVAMAVIGTLLGIALIVLLVYCCRVHKPYKKLRLRKKYEHIVDDTYGSTKDSFHLGDATSGAHPSPDFRAEADSNVDAFTSSSAKSPLVRRVKHAGVDRI